jgi:hypothetical protein
VALGDDVVLVDRLEVLLARRDEARAVELGKAGDDARDHLAHAVLDEARAAMGLFDDLDLVGALHQLVDLRGHARLGDLQQRVASISGAVLGAADLQGGQAALVVRRHGTRSRMRSICSPEKSVLGEALARAAATSSCAHGHAVMPVAETPTTRACRARRRPRARAACRSPASGSPTPARACARGSAPRSSPRRARPLALAHELGDVLASVSARNGDSLRTTSPIASLTTSSKRDMCAPFWSRLRSTKQSRRAKNSSSRMRTTFSTPVTPTRESPTRTPGGRAWTSSPARPGRQRRGEPSRLHRDQPSAAAGRSPVGGISDRRFWYHSALGRGGRRGGRSGGETDGSWGSKLSNRVDVLLESYGYAVIEVDDSLGARVSTIVRSSTPASGMRGWSRARSP